MKNNKINSLKIYLENNGFKKEASLLMLLYACKPMQSYEEPVSLFTLSKEFTTIDFNEQLSKMSDEDKQIHHDEIDIISFFMGEEQKNKIYKNLELSHCYIKEKETTLMSEWNHDKILIQKYLMQFSCIPITSEEVSMMIGGTKFIIAEKDRLNEAHTSYNENNPIIAHNDGQKWEYETTHSYETEELEEGLNSYIIYAKIIKYFFKETETEVYSLESISDMDQIPFGNCDKNKIGSGDPNVAGFGNASFGTREPI